MSSPRSKSQGPGYYVLPSTVGTSGPSYSFGTRPPDASVRKMPGPQSYDVTELTRYGRSSVPSCKLGAKLQHGSWYPKKKVESPGPGTYSPELYGSIQWKCSQSRLLPREPSQHSVRESASNTHRQAGDHRGNQGTGTYNTTNYDSFKPRQAGVRTHQ